MLERMKRRGLLKAALGGAAAVALGEMFKGDEVEAQSVARRCRLTNLLCAEGCGDDCAQMCEDVDCPICATCPAPPAPEPPSGCELVELACIDRNSQLVCGASCRSACAAQNYGCDYCLFCFDV